MSDTGGGPVAAVVAVEWEVLNSAYRRWAEDEVCRHAEHHDLEDDEGVQRCAFVEAWLARPAAAASPRTDAERPDAVDAVPAGGLLAASREANRKGDVLAVAMHDLVDHLHAEMEHLREAERVAVKALSNAASLSLDRGRVAEMVRAGEAAATTLLLTALMERRVTPEGQLYLKCRDCACMSPVVAPSAQRHTARCAVTLALAAAAPANGPVEGADISAEDDDQALLALIQRQDSTGVDEMTMDRLFAAVERLRRKMQPAEGADTISHERLDEIESRVKAEQWKYPQILMPMGEVLTLVQVAREALPAARPPTRGGT